MTRFWMIAAVIMAVSTQALAAESAEWVTAFDERFTEYPSGFKMLPGAVPGSTLAKFSLSYDKPGHAFSMIGYGSLTHSTRAGTHAVLDLALRFAPLDDDVPSETKTSFLLVLFDRSVAGIEIRQSMKADVPATVAFVQMKPGQQEPKVLRTVPLGAKSLDGDWQLRYRQGLLTLRQEEHLPGLTHDDTHTVKTSPQVPSKEANTLGIAYTGTLGIQVAGVSWDQQGGKVTCARMTLTGEPPRELTADEQETLKQAATLNQRAMSLYQDKKIEESLQEMQAASALYVKVHGEDHYDSANSFVNLATLLDESGKPEEAGKLWAKALTIHENTLGPDHPHTALTRFGQGKNLLKRGEVAKAKKVWTRCRDDRRTVLGPDDSLAKSLSGLLEKL
jgi:hypothetical protein